VLGTVGAPPEAERALRAAGCEVMLVRRMDDGSVDIAAALRLLAVRGITRVMTEGGPTLARTLIDADLADEITLTRSPDPLGDGVPALAGPLPTRYRPVESRLAGRDHVDIFRREP
jgi:diaminohydroxyphosphoribosylaminopyrimidine deaminase / 5-amino-6-(5-phosphoribosylamino)uracil reductase